MRVAVFGAAGFIGATFVERLLARAGRSAPGEGWDVVPCIHSTGNAWRLSRHGLALRSVDVTDARQVHEAVEGCTHVVNATRSTNAVMLRGLENVLEACRAAGVRRYVHLGSVSAYGDRAPGTVLTEDAEPGCLTDYGEMKLEQDRMVAKACAAGLPSLILVPPNISGAYSGFLLRVLGALRAGTLAFVDGGELPMSLVDVENLAAAMELALACPSADGRRLFITDGDTHTWREVVERLRVLAPQVGPAPSVTRAQAEALTALPVERASLGRTLRSVASIAVGSATRRIVKEDPLLGKAYRALASGLPQWANERLLRVVQGKRSTPAAASAGPTYERQLLLTQLRAVQHAGDAAQAALGYTPVLSFQQSMDAFEGWYRATHGYGSEAWPLLARL